MYWQLYEAMPKTGSDFLSSHISKRNFFGDIYDLRGTKIIQNIKKFFFVGPTL